MTSLLPTGQLACCLAGGEGERARDIRHDLITPYPLTNGQLPGQGGGYRGIGTRN